MPTDANTALQTAREALADELTQRGILPDHLDEVVDRAAEGLTASSSGEIHVALDGRILTRRISVQESLCFLAEATAQRTPGEWKRGGISDEEQQELTEQKHRQIDYAL